MFKLLQLATRDDTHCRITTFSFVVIIRGWIMQMLQGEESLGIRFQLAETQAHAYSVEEAYWKKKHHFPTLASPWCVFYCLKLCQILLGWDSEENASYWSVEVHAKLQGVQQVVIFRTLFIPNLVLSDSLVSTFCFLHIFFNFDSKVHIAPTLPPQKGFYKYRWALY